MTEQGLIYTNDNCISCNKCVRVCTSPGASYLKMKGDSGTVHIDPQRCIACGACFALCEHDAREYRDDTDAFFHDLMKGEPISVLIAPAFRATYPSEYAAVLGGLKKLGVRRIIDVAFGADICTWAYLKVMEKDRRPGLISTPCPVAVSYVEHCLPELIPLLMPVKSPMLCAATWCREELGITDRLAFIGPCIGKKLETGEDGGDLVQYNVTFLKLMERVDADGILGPDTEAETACGLGSFYPAPGGLADNVRWLLGDDTPIRVVSGKTYLYGWLKTNMKNLTEGTLPFRLIDGLNCLNGCVEGTAGGENRFREDAALYALGDIRRRSKSGSADSPWNGELSPAERLEKLNAQFSRLDPDHYRRTFTDRSEHCRIKYPSREEEDRIFREMHKLTKKSRQIDCSSCGYNSCRELMVAIYNGFNDKRSCIHYEKEETLRLERLSYCDQLTLVMNRNALEHRKLTLLPGNMSIAVIAADVNGLKETNDRYGHEAGDRLILNVASALSDEFGRDNVYRTGGDEFLVVLLDHTEEECAQGIRNVQKILEHVHASAAIGYAFSPTFRVELKELERQADLDMYEKKQAYYRERNAVPRTAPKEFT